MGKTGSANGYRMIYDDGKESKKQAAKNASKLFQGKKMGKRGKK